MRVSVVHYWGVTSKGLKWSSGLRIPLECWRRENGACAWFAVSLRRQGMASAAARRGVRIVYQPRPKKGFDWECIRNVYSLCREVRCDLFECENIPYESVDRRDVFRCSGSYLAQTLDERVLRNLPEADIARSDRIIGPDFMLPRDQDIDRLPSRQGRTCRPWHPRQETRGLPQHDKPDECTFPEPQGSSCRIRIRR